MNLMKKQGNHLRNTILRAILFLIVIFVSIQFYHPVIADAVPTAELQAPAQVKGIIKRACYDCHSNETDLRWYDKIAPVYWQVAAHIKTGREGLNFSTWGKMPAGDQKAKLWEAVNQIQAGAMPLKSYAFVHPAAKISAADLGVLKAYLLSLAPKNKLDDTAKENALQAQLNDSKSLPVHVPAALNGVPYFPDYKNWDVISTTERFDNGTMRIVFGNDIAVKAIRQNKIRPWPKGSVLAKAAWEQMEDKAGSIKTGAFKQVEFMIRDDDKYASTKGWGFARFKTTKLLPYGKTALFATECINCHRPQKDEDFVFTQPVQLQPGIIHDLHLKMMASFIDKKSAVTSVLYSQGATRTLITWKQKNDKNWFGANVPGQLLSVEKVTIGQITSYEDHNAQGLVIQADSARQNQRIKYILGLQPSVIPQTANHQ
jgi:hypothetical protein